MRVDELSEVRYFRVRLDEPALACARVSAMNMNAILHEECEAPVLTNEAIEVHLSYLRPAVEAVQADVTVLREKIEALDQRLSGKIEGLDKKLNEKMDQANKENSERFMKIQASQDGLKWFIGSLTLIASGVSIARSLGWI